MGNLEDNKNIVNEYFDAVNRGNEEDISNLLTDDFVFMSMYRKPEYLRFKWNKERFVAQAGIMSSQMKKPIVVTPGTMTAEDDRIAVEAESYGEMKNGKIYDNIYHFLFKLRNGKITEVREYSCSYTAHEVFGEFVV